MTATTRMVPTIPIPPFKTVAIASKAPVIAAEQYEQDDHDKDDPKQRHATISYFCVCAGAVALGVVVTDIDTLP